MMPLSRSDVSEILQQYSLGKLQSLTLLRAGWNVSYRLKTPRGDYVLKLPLIAGNKEVKNELRVLRSLDKRIPHLQVMKTNRGNEFFVWHGKCVYIVPFMKGTVVTDGAQLTPSTLTQLGKILAHVHHSKIDKIRKKQYYQNFKHAFAKNTLIGKTLAHLEDVRFYKLPLPRGFIHADLHTENMIVQKRRIAAIFDFEEATIAPFIYDIGLVLIDTCFTKDRFSPKRADALLRGYDSMRRLQPIEIEHLTHAMMHAALLEQYYLVISNKHGKKFTSAYAKRLKFLMKMV